MFAKAVRIGALFGRKIMLEQEIMEYMNLLKEADTTGVEPLTHIFGETNVFREDVVTNSDGSSEVLKNAPLVRDGMFVVPKTIG